MCSVQSHSAGRGPEFVRTAFNIYGRSPAVSQYLMSMNALVCRGIGVLVERTEVENLPPYPFLLRFYSVISFLQCFEALGWVTGKILLHQSVKGVGELSETWPNLEFLPKSEWVKGKAKIVTVIVVLCSFSTNCGLHCMKYFPLM